MTKPPADHENATHRCPECGGDATRTRDRHPFTIHGSRGVLRAFFFILAACYIGVILYFSNWTVHTRSFSGNPGTQRDSSTAYTVDGETDQGVSSTEELRGAIQGDDALLVRIADQIRAAIESESYRGLADRVDRLRLEYWTLEARNTETRTYSFFGQLYGATLVTDFADIRTRELAEKRPGQNAITYVHWWPTLHIQRESAGGQYTLIHNIHYLNIMALLTTLVWLSILARFLIVRCSRFRDRGCCVFWIILTALLLSTAGVSYAMSETSIRERSASFQPFDEGPWFEVSEILAALDSPQQTRWLLGLMSENMDLDQVVPYAVAFGREFVETESLAARSAEHPRLTEIRSIGWDLRSTNHVARTNFFTTREYRYDKPRTPQQIQQSNQATSLWKDLFSWGVLRFTLNTPEASNRISISPLDIILLVGVLWWFWAILSAIHGFRVGRTQRKRVNRGQCIYCAYRLPPEALVARFPSD